MSMKVAALHDTVITGGGPTQDFTIDGFGTPVGYMVWVSNATSEATDTTHLEFSEGFSDGTNHWSVSGVSENGVGASDTGRQMDTASVVVIWDAPGTPPTVLAEAAHSAFITDGVRLNWTTIPAAAYRIQILLFGGPDLQVEVGNENYDQAIDTTKDVTLAGAFQPDMVLFLGMQGSVDPVSLQTQMKRQIGAGTGDNNNIGVVGSQSRDNQITMFTRSWSLDDRVYAKYDNNFNNTANLINLVMLSDGFRLTKSAGDEPGGANNITGYMAFQSDTNKMSVETFPSPTSTGLDTVNLTDPALKPQCVILAGSVVTGIGSSVDQGYAMGIADGTRQSCMSYRDQDGVGTSSTDSRWNEEVLFVQNGAKTVISEAVFHSFQPGQVTFNYSSTDSISRRFMMIVFGADDDYSINSPR